MPPTPPRAPGQDPAVRRILRPRPAAAVVKGGADLPGPDAVDVLVQRRPGGGEPSVEVFAAPKIGQERVSGAGRA
ncbi:MAG: hypothetical protein LBD51_08495, partial [Bifidobacteriaceae bacterium]|nr:hypothetical protein [Bifidobacteriaceae bacterium]